MATRLGDPGTLLTVLSLTDTAVWDPTRVEVLLEKELGAHRLAEELGDPIHVFNTAATCHRRAVNAGRFDVAIRCLAVLDVVSTRLNQPTFTWFTTYRQGLQAILVGDTVQAEEFATAAFESGTESGQPDAFTVYGTQLAMIRRQQGRLGELVDVLREMITTTPGMPAYLAGLAVAQMEAGNTDEARALLETAAEGGFSIPRDNSWLDGMVAWAWVAIGTRSVREAGVLYESLLPVRGLIPCNGVSTLDPVSMYLGGLAWVLGDRASAEGYLDEAGSTARRGGMTYSVAEIELLLGTVKASGPTHGSEVRAHIVRAAELASAHGYASVGRRAEAYLGTLPG